MSDKRYDNKDSKSVTRREFLAASGAGLAAVSVTTTAQSADDRQPAGVRSASSYAAPFDSLRDYVAALEARGMLKRFGRIDQDAYEGTALMYRMVDHYDRFHAPPVLFEEVRIDGRWMKGPVVANFARHVDIEAILFGLEPVPGDSPATYKRARTFLNGLIEASGGAYPTIAPVRLKRRNAPCKEVIISGDDIDIRDFPFFQNNPGDSGRFINTATVFTSDPEMGLNLGTYRCEIKGPRHIAVGSGEGQSGYTMLMAAKERGETSAPIALVLGQDPIIWVVSGSRIPERRGKKPIDELATAGGLRGKAVEVVKCETNDFEGPAHAEMIIE